MKDTLAEQRKYFDEEFVIIQSIITSSDKDNLSVTKKGLFLQLINEEDIAEFAYRSGFIRGKIEGMGLGREIDNIIYGLNKSATRVIPSDKRSYEEFNNLRDMRTFKRAHSDAMLKFGLEYVDRWTMYDKLFRDKK